jgi:signal transduction histidine kinase
MTLRARLVLAFALVAAVPLLLLGLVLRHELERGVTREYQAALADEAGAVASALEAEWRRVGGQLSELVKALDDDNRLRRALVQPTGDDERYLLESAGRAMSLTGLSLLRLVDEDGRVLSSGHFRAESGRAIPGVIDAVAANPDGMTLLRAREPSAGLLTALVRADSLAIAGRRFFVLGGVEVDSAFFTHLPARRVALRPGESADTGPDDGSVRTAADLVVIAEGVDTTGSAAQVVVIGDPVPLHAALRRLNVVVAGGIAVAVALAVAMAWWSAARVSRPIVELADRTSRVDLESLDVDFANDRTDEVGQLADLLAGMVDRLKQSRNRLAAAERRATIGDLSRQVNHDIKNGLTPIRNVLAHLDEVAREAPADVGPLFLERRHTLESSMAYLDDLARNIASLTPEVSRRPCDVNAALRDIVAVGGSDAAVSLDLDGGDPIVVADPVAVRRVFQNLIDNALDGAGPRGRVDVSGRVGDAAYRVSVSDDGPGMDQDQLERAFNEWYTTKATGTGLGLPIVRRLVLDLGGSLRVETQPGRGTTMTVELPLDADQEKRSV